MDLIWDGLGEAVRIIQSGDFDVWEIAVRSIFVSGTATAISLFLGILVGSLIAFNQFPGRNLAFSLVNTGMGLPPVVVGLMVAIMLWRSGPLGEFRLIYTLAREQGRVLTRDELLQRVWGRRATHRDRTVDVFVRKLREKIDRRAPRHTFIHTRYGVGYKLEALPK